MTAERRATESGVFCIFYSLADLTLLAIGNPLLENQLGCSHQLLALHRSTCCLHQHKQTECQHLDLKSYRCTIVQRLSTRNTLTCIPSILKNMCSIKNLLPRFVPSSVHQISLHLYTQTEIFSSKSSSNTSVSSFEPQLSLY